MAKDQQQLKEEETKRLIQFIDNNNLWVDNINIDLYVSQGAEQKVYLKDGSTVLKLNDAIYYATLVGNIEIIKLIQRRNINYTKKYGGYTVLEYAMRMHDMNIYETLKKGSNS